MLSPPILLRRVPHLGHTPLFQSRFSFLYTRTPQPIKTRRTRAYIIISKTIISKDNLYRNLQQKFQYTLDVHSHCNPFSLEDNLLVDVYQLYMFCPSITVSQISANSFIVSLLSNSNTDSISSHPP